MKNKIKKLTLIIFISLIFIPFATSEEIKFEANLIELIDRDKRIIAKKNVKIFNNTETIYADEMDYDKSENIIKANGNILLEIPNEKIKIFGESLTYYKNKEEIILDNSIKIELNDKFFFTTDEAIYDKNEKKINVNYYSEFKDENGNMVSAKKAEFSLINRLLKIETVNLVDELKNKYSFNSAIINFQNNELIADGIKIDFFKNSFDNNENDPRLRGNLMYINDNKFLIKKGVFTTCKKRGDKCPPWQLKAQEIKHDKSKKTISAPANLKFKMNKNIKFNRKYFFIFFYLANLFLKMAL